jgi:hypothetical protein
MEMARALARKYAGEGLFEVPMGGQVKRELGELTTVAGILVQNEFVRE